MIKRVLLALAALAAIFIIAKKVRDANHERELWHEATTAPDLR